MDEVVETSDPEELEQLAIRKRALGPTRSFSSSPCKRRKLAHVSADAAPAQSFLPSPNGRTGAPRTSPCSSSTKTPFDSSSPPATPPDSDISTFGVACPEEEVIMPTFPTEVNSTTLRDGSEMTQPMPLSKSALNPMSGIDPKVIALQCSSPSPPNPRQSDALPFTPRRFDSPDELDLLLAGPSQRSGRTPPDPPSPLTPSSSPGRSSPPIVPPESKYPLRPRRPNQLEPYTHDRLVYRLAMKTLPEARVRIMEQRAYSEELSGSEQDYVEGQQEEESQAMTADEPQPESQKENTPKQLHSVMLPPLPPDDEEESSILEMRKEARRLDREAKRKQKQQRAMDRAQIEKQNAMEKKKETDRERRPSETNTVSRIPAGEAIRPMPSSSRSFTKSSEDNARDASSQRRRLFRRSESVQESRSDTQISEKPNELDILDEADDTARMSSPPPPFDGINMQLSDDAREDERRDASSHPPSEHFADSDAEVAFVDNLRRQSYPYGPDSGSDSDANDTSKAELKYRQQERALNRMIPAVLRRKLLKEAEAKAAAKAAKAAEEEAKRLRAEEPLLPGQSRARRAENPVEIRDIRGDSESDDDLIDDNDSDVGPILKLSREPSPSKGRSKKRLKQRSGKPPRSAVVQDDDDGAIWDSEYDDINSRHFSDEILDDHLRVGDICDSGLQERDMIDWMLSNTSRIGGQRQPKRHRNLTKLHVTTREARKLGRGRQTLLDFASHERNGVPSTTQSVPQGHLGLAKRRHGSQTRLVLQRKPEDDLDVGPLVGDSDASARRRERRQRIKERRERERSNGIFVMIRAPGSRIVGQMSKTIGLNSADLQLQRALTPAANVQSMRSDSRRPSRNTFRRQARRRGALNPALRPVAPRNPHVEVATSDNHRIDLDHGPRLEILHAHESDHEIVVYSDDDARTVELDGEPFSLDFGIRALDERSRFGPDTFIGSGSLANLVHRAKPEPPLSYSAQGIYISPDLTRQEFLPLLRKVCDGLFQAATTVAVDLDSEETEWARLARGTCQLFSFLLLDAEEDVSGFRSAVEIDVLHLVQRIRAEPLSTESIDGISLTTCWFAVELALRAGSVIPSSGTSSLQEACSCLAEALIGFGLEDGFRPLLNHDVIQSSTVDDRVFECWVSLWHVMHTFRQGGGVHPLWSMVQDVIASRHLERLTSLDGSECIWRSIFGLSAVSQFNEHGISKSLATETLVPRTCWDIVLFAVRHITLFPPSEATPEATLSHLERYLNVIVERCCLLWSEWAWTLENSWPVLIDLAQIFSTRKWCNFRHEASEYPSFLRMDQWEVLNRPLHDETTFVLYAKLVYQAVSAFPEEMRKVISAVTPTSSLSWSRTDPPEIQDLSMLYNRISFVAIAIYLNHQQYKKWVGIARQFVQFDVNDSTVRIACIRGFMYLTSVLVRLKQPLDVCVDWLKAMVRTVMREYTATGGNSRPTHVLMLCLANTVYFIYCAYQYLPKHESIEIRYPNPHLLLTIEPILNTPILRDSNNASNHLLPRLVFSFLTARKLCAPVPERPPLPAQPQSAESQDEYGGDLDLGFLDTAMATSEILGKKIFQDYDRLLHKLVRERLQWPIFRRLQQYVNHPETKDRLLTDDDMPSNISTLTTCYLGCADIVAQFESPDKPSWMQHLPILKDWECLKSFVRRRMNFLFYSTILDMHPMSYLDLKDAMIAVLFESLASWHTTSEDNFISLLLSIDGRCHPLFMNAYCGVAEDGSRMAVLTARMPFIVTMLQNLESVVDDDLHHQFVGFLIRLFAAIENTFEELDYSPPEKEQYRTWAKEVFARAKEHPRIVSDERLGVRWFGWATQEL